MIGSFRFSATPGDSEDPDFAMPDDTSLDSGPTRLGARLQWQFSLRDMLLLMAACAIWLWLLSDWRQDPFGFAVLALITLAVGVGGHVLYTYVLPWRGTVLVSAIVLPPLILGGLTGSLLDGWSFLTTLPVEFFMRQSWPDRMKFALPFLVSVVLLGAAHPIKPSLPTAIITAIGVSLWYGLSLLIAINTG